MGSLNKLLLRVMWGGRVDLAEAQVDMVWEMMGRFAQFGRFLADPWYTLRRHPYVVSESKDELRRWFNESAIEDDHFGSPSFTQSTTFAKDAPPHMNISTHLGGRKGNPRRAANSVVVRFECGENVSAVNPLPVEWLLGLSREIVTACVDVWHPDAVSLDTTELVLASPIQGSFPVQGFCSWFSDSVVDGSVGLPDAVVQARYEGGTLLGVAPDSSDPLVDALRLAGTVYDSDVLSFVPYVQGQPNPVPDEYADAFIASCEQAKAEA